MSEADAVNERMMAALVAGLRPVKRLHAPWVRALEWLALVAALAAVLFVFADLPGIRQRLMAAPDMWLAVVGSGLTAMLGAIAAFQLCLPDRTPWWAVLPLPGLLLWVSASGLGCARTWLGDPGIGAASPVEMAHCLRFIVGLSIPLSAVMLVMLRRGYSLYPALMGGTAGLAVAAASATLLVLFHPFDATVTDLSVHAAAVALVVVANRSVAKLASARRDRSANAMGPHS